MEPPPLGRLGRGRGPTLPDELTYDVGWQPARRLQLLAFGTHGAAPLRHVGPVHLVGDRSAINPQGYAEALDHVVKVGQPIDERGQVDGEPSG